MADTASSLHVIDAHADRMGRVLISGDLLGRVAQGQTTLQTTSPATVSTGCLLNYKPDGSLAWVGTFPSGGAGWAVPLLVTHDGLGNAFVAGNLTGTVDIDPSPAVMLLSSLASRSVLSSDFLIKLNSSGQLLWAARFPETVGIQKITSDSSGNVIIAGFLSGPSDLDPGAGVFSTTVSSGYFVVKLNAAGSFKWGVTASLGGGHVHALSTDGKGRINLGGYCFGQYQPCNLAPSPAVFTSSICAGFVVRLDSNGLFSDGTLIPGGMFVTSIETDKNDNRLVAGRVSSYYSYNDLDPGPASVPVSTLVTAFIEKLDPASALVWVRTIEVAPVYKSYQQYYIKLYADRDGKSWVCLDAGGPLAFQSTVGTVSVQSSSTGLFYALAHYDASGTVVWSGDVGPLDTRWSWHQTSVPFAATQNGDIYLSALTNTTCELEPVTGSFTVSPIHNNYTFIEKLTVCDAENPVTASSLNNTICRGDTTYLVASGALYYQWEPYLPPVPVVRVSPVVNTVYEVAAIDSMGCMNTATVSVMVDACLSVTELRNSEIKLYPVPAKQTIFLEPFEDGRFSLRDIFGRELMSRAIDHQVTEISLSEYPPGIYLWELKTLRGSHIGKLIKE